MRRTFIAYVAPWKELVTLPWSRSMLLIILSHDAVYIILFAIEIAILDTGSENLNTAMLNPVWTSQVLTVQSLAAENNFNPSEAAM